jgi:flagellar basal-body rod modification protein FlgD
MQISATTSAETAQTLESANSKQSEVSKDAFLQLLVAQIKNQDPLNPTDGAQFLSQLAQFSQLEQLIGLRDDLRGMAGAQKTAPGDQQ